MDWPEIPSEHPLKERLEALRKKLTSFFAVDGDSGYRPPLSEAELAAFEATHQVELPTDYRAFLQYVQAGGHGPYYGLTPFEFAAPDATNQGEAGMLAEPFSLQRKPDIPVLPGTLWLCHQGRGYYARLVVSGEARGQVFYLNDDAQCIPYFVRDGCFLDWYERWLGEVMMNRIPTLNQTLSGSQRTWFGYDNPVYQTHAYIDEEGLRQIEWKLVEP